MPGKIFINYRRAQDGGWAATIIRQRLQIAFGPERVFLDDSEIEPGNDFAKEIDTEIAQALAVVIVIGKGWQAVQDKHGNQRIRQKDDWVRREIRTTLQRSKRGERVTLIPLLIDDAEMPEKDGMPRDLWPLLRNQYLRLRREACSLEAGLNKLVTQLSTQSGLPIVSDGVPGEQPASPRVQENLNFEETAQRALEEQQSKILFELARLQQPIREIGIFVGNLLIPIEHESLQPWKQGLDDMVNRVLATQEGSVPGARVDVVGLKGEPLRIVIKPDSPNVPDQLRIIHAELAIYKSAANPNFFRPFYFGGDCDPDLRFVLTNEEQPVSVSWDPETSEYNFLGTLYAYEPRSSNFCIQAVPDLPNCQMFISFYPISTEHKGASFELRSIRFMLNSREAYVEADRLKKRVNREGDVFWELVFPSDIEDLFRNG